MSLDRHARGHALWVADNMTTEAGDALCQLVVDALTIIAADTPRRMTIRSQWRPELRESTHLPVDDDVEDYVRGRRHWYDEWTGLRR